MVLGIDPGTTETGYCLIDDNYNIHTAGKLPNGEFLTLIGQMQASHIACESIQSYGMAVGREVFETAYFIGEIRCISRLMGIPFDLYPRPEYAKSICGVSKINDSVLRQSLLLRFGGDKKGEPLFLLKGASDKRSAFAVAVYHMDKTRG